MSKKGIKRWEFFASILFALIALFFFGGIVFIIITKLILGEATPTP